MIKSPINWYGGKYYMANKIINLFPEHKAFVEVFGGAAHVLFKKKPSPIEVYNDINSDLVNFFKVVRDKEKALKLKQLLDLTPHSREEYYECRDSWRDEKDEIERVRKWYVALMQSYGGTFTSWQHGKTVSRRGMSQSTSKWLSNIEENLPSAIDRLKTVQIENLDYKQVIHKYDNKDTLFYLDPPYIHETRKSKQVYDYEMSNEQHKELVEILLKIKGKAILSGYDHKIYNELINNGWKKVFLGEFDKKSMNHNAETVKGKEFVWINY